MDWRIWVLAVLFGLAETAYFGWNITPKSSEEMICDGITMVLLAMAFMSQRST